MSELPELTLLQWVSTLGGPTPTPAGGALALVTLGGAAALAGKILTIVGRESSSLGELSGFFVSAADEDGRAYATARKTGPHGMVHCLETGCRHLERASQLLETIGEAFDSLPPALAADMAAAGRLARASAETLLTNLAVNFAQWSDVLPSPAGDQLKADIEALKSRMEAA